MGSSIIFLCVASLLLVGSINADLHELNLDTREHQVRQASTSASITTSTTTGNSTGVLPNTTSVTLTVYYNGTTNTGCLVCGNSTYTCSPDKNWINYTIPEFRVGEYQKYQIIKTITVLAAGVNVVKDDENAENSPSLTFYLIDSLNRSTYLFSQFAAYDSETCQSTCQSILKPKDSDYQQITMAPTGSFKIAMTTQSFSFCASYISIKIGLALGDQPIVITNGLGIGSTSGSSPAPDSAFSGDSIKIILGVIGGLIVLVILIAVIIVIARRVKDKKDKKYKEQHPMIDMNTKRSQSQIVGDNLYAPISIFKDDIKGVNKIDDIEVLDKLGAGNFGEVYRGVWQGTTFVALKRLTGDLHEFVKEASTLMRLNHPNIVRMLGVHSNPNGEYIVTEFMSLGSVDKFLQKRRLGLSDLLSLCHQAASGMNYLEKEKLVHRDLAARNLLVAEEGNKFTVKVADFGLSRTTTEGIYEAQGGQFPIKWSALECLQYRIFTSQSDVWSFGICLWEIFSFGMMPYLAWDNETTVTNIMKGYRLEQPEACPPEVYEIMLNCWKVDAAQRPTFRELFDSLFLLHRASENPELQQAPVQQEQV